MSRSSILRSLCTGLLALTACANFGTTSANQTAPVPLGVDLGGRPARAASEPMVAVMSASDRSPGRSGEMQMVHEGHAGAHGTGTVNAVNIAQRKIGMRHEPIPELGWPVMTMEFAVAPAVNLQAIQPGARINFTLEKARDGSYVIQSVQPAGGGR
jgi:Cu/Ag efflux protein CusF